MCHKLGLYVKLVALCIHTCCSSHQAATLPDIRLQRGSLAALKYLNPDAHLDLLTYLSIVKAPPCPPPHPGYSSLNGLTGPGPATPMISWPLRRGFHRSARLNQRHLAPNPNLQQTLVMESFSTRSARIHKSYVLKPSGTLLP